MAGAATSIATLFEGLDRAHGEFRISGRGPSGKVIGKAATVRSPATPELWQAHLAGKQGLGIVPIRADDTCLWACLDIDDHQIDHNALVARIREAKLPLIVARSKSGGAHAFVFFRQPVDCAIVREHLLAWAAWLGYGGCEIFPKQSRLADKDDVGNWLNMPYFDAARTVRYALHPDTGEALELADFVALAEERRITADDLAGIELPQPAEDVLPGAPPCLQMLASQSVPAGQRNEALFNFGVYCRLSSPDDWEDRLEEINHEIMTPPLKSGEVQAVVKSLKRKDYFYRCEQPPIRPLCNKPACRRCKHGIGGAGQVDIEITGLTRVDTRPPVWYADVDGERLQLSTEDLVNQRRFAVRCMETLGKWPTARKPAEWQRLINQLMETMEVVEVPRDSGPEGQFWDLLWQYLEGQGNQAGKREDILARNLVWREDGYIWFRSIALTDWLKMHRFTELPTSKIWALLRSHPQVRHKAFNIRGRCIQVWGMPYDDTRED